MTSHTLEPHPSGGHHADVQRHFSSAPAEMLGAILDQSQDCIKVIGPTGRLDFMNRNGRCAMEIDDFANVAGRYWWELWPEEAQPLIREAVEKARAGENFRFEAYCATAKGKPRWWEVAVSPLTAADGTLQGIISVSRDVSERVAARELRETAAAEMRHRLQNAYTLAAAIVQAEARGSPERQAFARDILTRLEQLGIAQTLLLEREGSERVSLREVVMRLTDPFGGQACDVHRDGLPDVMLAGDNVRILALAVGEFGTNSSKYGALRHGGAITIHALVEDGALHLHWSERSAGPSSSPSSGQGKGHRLIERALRSRGGRFDLSWRNDGLDASIVLPLS